MSPEFAHPAWIVYGFAFILIGVWMIRWAARNNMASAIKDATVMSAFDALAKRGRPDMPAEMRAKIDEIRGAPGAAGKIRKVASYSVRQSLSQLAGIIGFMFLMLGFALMVLGALYP